MKTGNPMFVSNQPILISAERLVHRSTHWKGKGNETKKTGKG